MRPMRRIPGGRVIDLGGEEGYYPDIYNHHERKMRELERREEELEERERRLEHAERMFQGWMIWRAIHDAGRHLRPIRNRLPQRNRSEGPQLLRSRRRLSSIQSIY